MGSGVMLLLASVAMAQDGWYIGLPVASVSLQAPDGGLPEESLEPLLHVRQGDILYPQTIRADMSTLFRVGEFSAVQADVEPWFVMDEEGQMRDAVQVTYLVWPAPRVERLVLAGRPSLPERQIRAEAGIDVGEVFYPSLDGPRAEARVTRFFQQHGFALARVEVTTEAVKEGWLDVTLRIDEGAPEIVGKVVFYGDQPVPEAALERWAAKAGVQEGKPYVADAVGRAQYALERNLASPGGLLSRDLSYVSARVTPAVVRDVDGSFTVTYTVEPGPRLELDVEGLGWRPEAAVRQALGIDERLRLTRGFVESAPDRIETWLARRGYADATAKVELVEAPDTKLLSVRVDRGPRYMVRGFSFSGNTVLDKPTLVGVIEQTSDDVLRHGWWNEGELTAGLEAAERLYEAHGHLEARLTQRALDTRKGLFGRMRVRAEVEVAEGPVTLQEGVVVQSDAEGVDLADPLEDAAAMAGKPHSPQQLDALARRIVEAHRSQGYLDADARVHHEPVGDRVRSVIRVEPGTQVLLRSVVTRGAQRTRPSTIRRQTDLTLGAPVTPEALAEVRRSVYELGVFRGVELSLLGDGAARDLVITVDERRPWGFELGGGISSDQGIRAFGRATRYNILRRAHRLDTLGVVGLEYRDFTQPEWKVSTTYSAPHTPFRFSTSSAHLLLRERALERTWTLRRSGVGLVWELNHEDLIRFQTSGWLEARQLEVVDLGALLPTEAWATLIDLDRPVLPSPLRLHDRISVSVVADTRDDPRAPTRGWVLSAQGAFVPGLVTLPGQPTTSFASTSLRFTGHLGLGARGSRVRGSLDGAWAPRLGQAPVPLEDRLRLGGTGSLRGYPRDSLGPRNLTSRVSADWPDGIAPILDYALRDNPIRYAPTGGDLRTIGSVDLLLPLPVLGLQAWDGYDLALFGDVGNVWLVDPASAEVVVRSPSIEAEPPVRVGTGIGVRSMTAVGPLQIDLAVNPQRAFATGALRSLLVEDYEEPWVRVHVTLGGLW